MPIPLDEAVSVGARRVVTALAEPGSARGRDEWLVVVGDCQSLINTLTAVQDAAIAEVARRESDWCEDGTPGETVHGLGRVTLDAADLAAPVLGASHAQAQRRVEQAVRLAAGRVPVEADDRELPVASGLSRLHEAMAAGHLDAYRAGVVAFELEVAPADVADAIVSALDGHLGDDASALRRRTRVLLSRISPDLVRERAKRARASTGLRRWVGEPGVDEWHGTFPSEEAAAAWAAIDRLAHDLVSAGTCSSIEQARGKALTDLVTGNATVDIQVVLTVPADSDSCHPAAAGGTGGPDPAAAGATGGSNSTATDTQAPTSFSRARAANAPVAHQPPAQAAVDVPRLTPSVAEQPQATTSGGSHTRDDDDLVEVQGARPSEPLLVRRAWLRGHLTNTASDTRPGAEQGRPRFVPCDAHTGARLDPDDHLATDAYRPGAQLAALVRARDGRCRFPGCSVAARFCDLDHVRPWPTGRTVASNLLTLCRRHHRIKQRPGWRVQLAPDATATWTDPTGRRRITEPLDALRSLVLVSDAADGHAQAGARAPVDAGGSGWSALETHLEIRLEHQPSLSPDHDEGSGLWQHPTHRRCTSALDLRAASARRRARAPVPDAPPF